MCAVNGGPQSGRVARGIGLFCTPGACNRRAARQLQLRNWAFSPRNATADGALQSPAGRLQAAAGAASQPGMQACQRWRGEGKQGRCPALR